MRAGDQLAATIETDLPATSTVFWVLTAVIANLPTRQFIPAQPAPPALAALPVAADGTVALDVPTSVTLTWAPGRYEWVLLAVDVSGNRTELAQGKMTVQPDLAGATPADPRSPNEKLLANIKALIDGKALDDVAMYKIGSRELTKMPILELLKWKAIVAGDVRRERIARGEIVPSRTLGVSFGGDYRGGRR